MVDVCIIGSGLAGLTVAAHLPSNLSCLIVSDAATSGNSWLAQGGIAAALDSSDTTERHLADTLDAGDHHVDGEVARYLVEYGKEFVREALHQGFPADRMPDGSLNLGTEAAHSSKRILHAGGDQTGYHWMTHITELTNKLQRMENVRVHSLVVDNGRCQGVRIYSASHEIQTIFARVVILATGGIGDLFSVTSNSRAASGTGLSLAYHAGAALSDLEFIQFHPTVAVEDNKTIGLVTEAVRGAGATFCDVFGQSLPINPLAPRDATARAVEEYWQRGFAVYLNVAHIDNLDERFPTIKETLQKMNNQQLASLGRIPVRPGAHFHMGGVSADITGRTSLPGLYAVGEVACTGVHGANRLASNSLLECLVLGNLAAKAIAEECKSPTPNLDLIREILPTPFQVKEVSRRKLTEVLGVIRDEHIEAFSQSLPVTRWDLEAVAASEIESLHRYTTVSLLTKAASLRTESRGAHFRKDHPEATDAWLGKVIVHSDGTEQLHERKLHATKERVLL